MNSTTLRGIFPDPKPIHRRNFLRENIKHLKEMQGFIQKEAQIQSNSQLNKPNKFKQIPKTLSINKNRSYGQDRLLANDQLKKNFRPAMRFYSTKNKAPPSQKTTHRGVQTERPEDLLKLYETGPVKFPSPSVVPQSNSKQISSNTTKDQGDIAQNMEKLDLNEKTDHIKRNINNLKSKVKPDEVPDPTVPPPYYKKGVLPKYLKDKDKPKEEAKANVTNKATEYEGEQISGLVLLPDEERKEYLRVARENYASLIKELNSMPVSNDTLKRRKRKMEIEEELKRLDEVIKIFQKPKVYVKADA